MKATKDPNKVVRRKAIRALARSIPIAPVFAALRPFLQDDDPDIVYDTIWAIRDMHLRPDDLLPDIFAAMSKHAAASSILSPAGWLIESMVLKLMTLMEIVRQDLPELKGAIWALRSLESMQWKQCLYLLNAIIKRINQSENILWALGYIGGDVSFELLRAAAYSPDPDLQIEALESLGNIMGYTQEKETILVDLAKSEDDC